ncbi:hypothetical protein [Acetobacter senegalensis]|uniref:hypothetical protein n=1 Tax=Acetobacter senegalensis TaxID=446692 RepID=UPI001EE10CA9|nr:hypothetical protein [Acetobacter senegalensis]MCG4274228.1 hypothetical protein [Acetobacter senegalensis]
MSDNDPCLQGPNDCPIHTKIYAVYSRHDFNASVPKNGWRRRPMWLNETEAGRDI